MDLDLLSRSAPCKSRAAHATEALRLRLKLRLHQPIVGDLYAFLKHSRDPGPAGDLLEARLGLVGFFPLGLGVGLRV